MRLFTALWPPADAVAHLRAALPVRWPDGVRPVPPERWHVTLRFSGDDADAAECARRLRSVAGAPAPRLRLAGGGAFPGVLWAGVRPRGPADAAALSALATALGADPARFRPHLSVARTRRDAPPDHLPGYRGPLWTAGEVRLVAGERTADGARYRVVDVAALAPARAVPGGSDVGW